MDPFFAAGLLAAAYDLGLGRSRNPAGGAPRDTLRDMGLAGILGYGAGAHGREEVADTNHQLIAALQRMAMLRSQERSEALAREAQLREALTQTEQHRRALEIARWAQLASQRADPRPYIAK